MFSINNEKLGTELTRRNFTVHFASNSDEAVSIATNLVHDTTVGFGGSATLNQLGLFEKLQENGNTVYWHAKVTADRAYDTRKTAAQAKWYMASSNAITESGILINIDGAGNRVAAMISGPEKVMLFIGKNKLVSNIEAGIERIKSTACPQNARRLNLTTLPCGITGKCVDCSSSERMCNVTTIIERKPNMIKEFHLILIDEELGF